MNNLNLYNYVYLYKCLTIIFLTTAIILKLI